MTTAVLPRLRDDLGLHPGPEARDGTPTWTIHDPSRNRYFRIGHAAFELLARWHVGDAARVLDRVRAEAGLALGERDIEWMVRFLDGNNLIRRDGPEAVGRLHSHAAAQRKSWWTWLIHNYLFFRIPLVRPDRFLGATARWVRPFHGGGFLAGVAALWAVGIVLVLRQWDVFFATIPHLFTWQGAAWIAGALGLSKLIHELGHAYTAKRFGCRVPTMGVAFMVLMPMLYTDTSDTWKLVSRRQRLAVAAAGMAAELALGGLALLAWSFLPDGPARSAAFSVVTVAVVATLVINLTPFMRFDGYYLLSDALGVENLQDRAFALARWKLREVCLGVGEPAPEHFPPRLAAILIGYSYATWLYRLLLFLGIALLVYTMFFKMLGIVLFAVEIVWFIAKPIWGEAKEWWTRRHHVDCLRLRLSLAAGAAALLLLVVPWRGGLEMPAVIRAQHYSVLYPPVAGRLVELPVGEGDVVVEGAVLARLSSPDLDHQFAQSDTKIALQRALLLREVASAEARQSIHVLRSQLQSLERERDGLAQSRARLTVRAPVAGEVVDIPRAIRPGLWVHENTPLVYLADRSKPLVTAYLAEEDLRSLAVGASARFIPDDPALPSWPCRVISISDVNLDVVDIPMLASLNGGPVAVREDRDGRPVPTKGHYRVELEFEGEAPLLEKALRGEVVADGARRSVLGRVVDSIATVLIRESGF